MPMPGSTFLRYEWQARLFAGGGSRSRRQFSLPVNFKEETAGRQLYLLVDCDSAAQLSELDITIDDTKLDSPIIPAPYL